MKKYMSVFLVLLFLVPLLAKAQTKRQTVDWLNKYADNVLQKYYSEKQEQISFKVDYEGNVSLTEKRIFDGYSDTYTYNFNLKNLDPSKVRISTNPFGLSCTSTECVEVRRLTSFDYEDRYTDSSVYLDHRLNNVEEFENDPMVKRLRKAFTHAIKLFGGQTVEKDLFGGN